MNKKTRAVALFAAVPATLGLAFGAGAAVADSPEPAPVSIQATPASGTPDAVIHQAGLDLDDIHVPRHIREQVDRALAPYGIQIPWHLLDDDWDDDDWDDDRDDDDWDDDDWDDDDDDD